MDNNKQDKIKEISIELLCYFDSFCKEHNLKYTISFGTALGAVRHGGFIPWDDDVDVSMPIEDYYRFEKLWKKYGNKEKYFLQSKKTEPLIPVTFNRLRLNGTTWSEPGYEKYPIHYGIPIDIFPIYNVSNNYLMRKIQCRTDKLGQLFCSYPWRKNRTSGFLVRISAILSRMVLIVLRFFNFIFSKSGVCYCSYDNPMKCTYRKEWLFPCKDIKFENIILQICSNPDKCLTECYGDYMTPPPEDKREGHPEGIIDLENDSEKYTGVRRRNK